MPGLRELKQRVVVLEDKPKRINIFKHWFQNYDFHITKTIREGIELLRVQPADYLFLDFDIHDPGDRTLREWLKVGHKRHELDGLDLAEYCVRRLPAELRPKNIIVHSRNPVGRKLMFEYLERKGLKPLMWKFWYTYGGPDATIPPPPPPPPSPPKKKKLEESELLGMADKFYAKYGMW